MTDRTIAPGPRRVEAARRAGIRVRARWLGPSLSCLALAAAIELGDGATPRRWGSWLESGLGATDIGQVLGLWLGLMVSGVALVFVCALALGNLGPVRRAQSSDLPSGIRTPGLMLAGIVIAALVLLVAGLAPVAAGAARAADASVLALSDLWARWAAHLLASSGLLLLMAGLAEHRVMRQSLRRDLHMTRAQAREQARQAGGR